MGLKINLHITQKCNYRCKYCFAHFADREDLPLESWKHIIDNIKQSGEIDAINFAGGEPVLYRGFHELMEYAYRQGFQLSIISNGSLMMNPILMPHQDFAMLDTLGISVDSVDSKTLVALGACNASQEVLSYDRLATLIRTAREWNPNIRIKLNTVITSLNSGEDLSEIGQSLSIDRWKMLRMKLFSNGVHSNADLVVGDEAFSSFVDRHRDVSRDVVPENDLTRSYIMVDNMGRLLDDEGMDYRVVGSLVDEDFSSVFPRYHFDRETYESRYEVAAG